eukprot:3636598-Rhodomonas_salina.1
MTQDDGVGIDAAEGGTYKGDEDDALPLVVVVVLQLLDVNALLEDFRLVVAPPLHAPAATVKGMCEGHIAYNVGQAKGFEREEDVSMLVRGLGGRSGEVCRVGDGVELRHGRHLSPDVVDVL